MEAGASNTGDLLVMILDCNPFWWGKSILSDSTHSEHSATVAPDDDGVLATCLDSVLALANAHLLFDAKNDVAIIACHNNRTKFLSHHEPPQPPQPTPIGDVCDNGNEDGAGNRNTAVNDAGPNGAAGDGATSNGAMVNGDAHLEENSNPIGDDAFVSNRDGKYEKLATMNEKVQTNLKTFVAEEADVTHQSTVSDNDSVVAGAMGMALCYIHKRRKTQKDATNGEDATARILIVKGAEDSSSQYLNFMNTVFTAQRQNVTIDSCVLGKVSSLLQQAADITGGICLKIPLLSGLTQYLMWVFLPSPSLRDKLSMPPSEYVDYRAACFCHRNLIDIGFVCSVCLSIFCSFSPICSTCHTTFKIPVKIGSKKTKKT